MTSLNLLSNVGLDVYTTEGDNNTDKSATVYKFSTKLALQINLMGKQRTEQMSRVDLSTSEELFLF